MLKTVTHNCHLEYYTQGLYNVSNGSFLLTTIGLETIFYDNVIEWGKGPHQGLTEPWLIKTANTFNQ